MSRRKIIITSIIATILASAVIIGVFGLSGWFGKSGAGFNSTLLPDYKYRRAITLSGQTSDLTDYQVKIELSSSLTSSLVTAGKLQSDLDDIRFTDANDNQLLNFWIETATTTATSTIWVKVPGLSASKSSTIYIYYGKPSASSASNGANTLVAFDATTFTNVGSGIVVNSDKTVSWSNPAANSYLYKTIPAIGDFVMRYGIQANPWSHLALGLTSYVGVIDPAVSETISFRWSTPGGTSSLLLNTYNSQYQQIVDNPTSAWYYMELRRVGTTATLSIYSDSNFQTLINSLSLTVSSTALTNVYYYGTTDCGAVTTNGTVNEKLYVRKYVSPEPTATVGDEQTQLTPVLHLRMDEGSGTTAYDSTPNNLDATFGNSPNDPEWITQ